MKALFGSAGTAFPFITVSVASGTFVVFGSLLDLAEEVGSEDEIVEQLVVGLHHLVLRALPGGVAFVNEKDVLADAHHGVHVVGVDDGGGIELLRDVVDEFVDDERRFGVKSGIGLVTEEVLGVEGNGAGNGHALLHTAGYFAGIFRCSIAEVDAIQTELGTADAILITVGGEHIKGEHDVFQHGHGVEQRRALENHAHLAAEQGALALGHAHEAAPVVEHIALGRLEEADDVFYQNGLAGTALADDEVGLSAVEARGDAPEHFFVAEGLMQVSDFYHDRSCVRKRSEKRMSMEQATTASVLALPTSMLPPSTW